VELRRITRPHEFQAASALRAQFGTSARRAISPDYYEWKYSSPRSALFGWHTGQTPVAMLGVCCKPGLTTSQSPSLFELCDAFTSPAFQGRGLFRQLVQACLDYLGALDAPAILYGTPNVNAHDVYVKHFGFLDWPRACRQFLYSRSPSAVRQWLLHRGASVSRPRSRSHFSRS
jgi:GNAT superfamily N-acetyltransferase